MRKPNMILLVLLLILFATTDSNAQQLAWDQNAEQEEVLGYYLYMDNFSTPIATLDAETTTYDLPAGLIVGQVYTFAVSAFNSVGESPKAYGKYRHTTGEGKLLTKRKKHTISSKQIVIGGQGIEIWAEEVSE